MASVINMPDPPGPRSAFFGLPLSRSLQRDRLGALKGLAREYGDIVGFRAGPQRLVLLSHPDYVRDVLVTRARLSRKGARSSARSACSARGC